MAAPNTANNGFLASESEITRMVMKGRRLATDVPHITSLLDKLPEGAVVLEVGCGPGGITLDIAQRYPHLTVLGVDIDETSIQEAKEDAEEAGTKNVRYAHGDAVELANTASVPGFEALKGNCDLIYTNATIQHCPDQPRTVKQLRDACKSGGTVFMCEGDTPLSFCHPSNPGMDKFFEVLQRLSKARGAQQGAGRRLLGYALSAGYSMEDITDLGMRSAGSVYRPGARMYFGMGFASILHESLEDDKVKEASVKPEELDLIKQGLDEWSKSPDGVLFWPAIVLTCVKDSEKVKAST